ncbi:MAG: MerR family transcriptional regulator [Oscillospiraceae bacterium]|nr:MerR family transcriptional regulator [Oscillospiraceae bacterium]
MTIKEIEDRSGMTRANIRFYESEGLLHPGRRENGYRDYSSSDLEALLPKHRGDITVDEFCENYNKLADFLDRNQFLRLDAETGWVARPLDGVYVTVVETIYPPLTFAEDNGVLTGVRFEESVQSVM